MLSTTSVVPQTTDAKQTVSGQSPAPRALIGCNIPVVGTQTSETGVLNAGESVQKGEDVAVRQLTGVFVVATAFLAAPAAVIAQTEKISVRMAPKPNQTARQTSSTEMEFDISSAEAGAAPGFMRMQITMRMTMAMTLKTGALKQDGTLDAELTYDQFRAEMSMNGQTMPADAGSLLAGKTVVMTYDRNGEIVGVRGLDAAGLTNDAFRQMLGPLFGSLPATALAVGETTTVPLDFMLPLPLPSAAPITLVGQTRLKLASVDKDARGRAATFESTMAGSMVTDLGSPQEKVSLDFSLSGQGTYVVNLETGMVRSNVATSDVNGKINVAGNAAAPGGMTMRGTLRMTMTGD